MIENEGIRNVLRDFLRYGYLSGLKLGLTQEQVIRILGQPEMVGGLSHKHRQPFIFKYGNLELHFGQSSPHICTSIYIENSTQGELVVLPSCFRLEEWSFLLRFRQDEIERYLDSNDIPFVVVSSFVGIHPVLIIPRSEVSIHFDEDGYMWSISVSQG